MRELGVDKADIRLVVHLDTPGSLENYLQEAGRAGRDQDPARCVLLYDDADLDVQFRLLRNSRLTQHDIYAILKALRSIEKKDRSEGSVVVTSGEILLEIPDKHGIDPEAPDADTKVRIAVAWLEEARLLERKENHTRVFPGSLQITDLDEARAVLEKKLGPNADIKPYVTLLSSLFYSEEDEGISTDDLMLATGRDSHQVQQMLRDLNRLKLISNDAEIGVTLYRDPDSIDRLEALRKLENTLIDSLREAAPDADQEQWQILNVRRLCDTLRRDAEVDLQPDKLTRLMKSFAESFGDGPGQRGFFALRPAGQDNRFIKLLRPWRDIEIIRHRRMRLAQALLNFFLDRRQGNNLLVTCKQGELEAALQADLTLQDLDVRDWMVALAAALIYMNTNEVLHLARGKAIFRTAMTIKLNTEARRRQFKKSDYAELALHYKDKIIQVHVMAEYARLALDKIQAAMSFIVDYFGMDRDKFIRRYFVGREDILEMATTEAAHRRILTDLQNPAQQAIVAAPLEGNHLILAGPGSGKTKVIVHRVAWVLRECMVLPEEIMVLSYNRSAAIEIRRRLWALIGPDTAGVTVQTIHGLAMRLTGTSCAVAAERGETVDFSAVIKSATAQLKQAEQGDDIGPAIQRDRLLSGLRYLLVVGDDDQNIYAFGGANVRFIKQFTEDYQAKTYYLTENYRSTAHIIHCANRVMAPARERMKTQQTIRVNYARQELPEGGDFAALDSLAQGRVHIIETPIPFYGEVDVALAELIRLNRLENSGQTCHWGRFAIIARHWEALEPMAALCRQKAIPVRLMRDDYLLDLHATREGYGLLSLLNCQQRSAHKPRVMLRYGVLSRWFKRRYRQKVDDLIDHPYRAMLAQFIIGCESVAPGCQHVISNVIEELYEFRTGSQAGENRGLHASLLLLTAHRAKGLEFYHVLILDGGGWRKNSDDERRLFYVAMTRARKTLTLCARKGQNHPFIRDCAELCLKTQPNPMAGVQLLKQRTWRADSGQVVLSWPGYFALDKPIHRAIAELDVGSELILRGRSDGKPGWEIADNRGVVVAHMARAFSPPEGEILSVRVSAIQVRHKKSGNQENIRCDRWEVVLPEIVYSVQ